MNDNNLIHGRTICAMVNDNTSVKEILQMLGVEPTDEVITEATNYCAMNGNDLNLENIYNFLKQKSVMSKLQLKNKKLASVEDLR